MLPYFAAHALLAAPLTRTQRWRSAAPALGLGALYLAVRNALGYGVQGSGLYLGLADGPRLLFEMPARCAALAADLLLGIPARWYQANTPLRAFVLDRQLIGPELFHALPDWKSLHALLGALALLLGFALVRALARRAPAQDALPFLALGSLLALLPVAAAQPSPRLLVAPAVGATALLAAAIVHGLARVPRHRALALLGAAALAVHLGVVPYRTHAASGDLATQAQTGLRWARAAEIPHDAGATDIAIVSASDFATATNLPWMRQLLGLPLPRSYRRLSGADQAHRLLRVDAHSFDLYVLSNDVRDAFAGSVHRPRTEPFVVGQRMHLRGMHVQVLGVSDGNPNALRFTFDAPLDDPRVLVLHATPEGLQRLTLPAAGEALLLPRAAVPWEATGR
jgi:hypothetical protein